MLSSYYDTSAAFLKKEWKGISKRTLHKMNSPCFNYVSL